MTRSKNGPPLYGFPQRLLDTVDDLHPAASTPCGLCGDTILGQRHRIIDAIRDRLLAGEVEVLDDYRVQEEDAWVFVAAAYEHDLASARETRQTRAAARALTRSEG